MNDHPTESMMEYPVDGCRCANCEYARYFDALSPDEKKRELYLIASYDPDGG